LCRALRRLDWPRRKEGFGLPGSSRACWPAARRTWNPIEPCRSKLTTRLRAKPARTTDALDAEPGPALATITAQDAYGWFQPGGCPILI
jgi:hypothetical protein